VKFQFVGMVLFNWALSRMEDEEWHIEMESFSTPEGNFVVEMTEVSPRDLEPEYMRFFLLDDARSAVPGVQGKVSDIYGLDPLFGSSGSDGWSIIANLTFIDVGFDGMISTGDYFFIRNVVHGGQAAEGYRLMLKFSPDRYKMPKNSMPDGPEEDYEVKFSSEVRTVNLPTSRIIETFSDPEVISLEHDTGVLSGIIYFTFHYPRTNIVLRYHGDGSRMLTAAISDEYGIRVKRNFTVDPNGTITIMNWIPVLWDTVTMDRESRTFTVEVRSEDGNETYFSGSINYDVMQRERKVAPSFSHPPALQLITASLVFAIAGWNFRKERSRHQL